LTELSQELPTDDLEPASEVVSRPLEESITQLGDEGEEYEGLEDDEISERFVYTRFILRQSLRFQQFVDERLIGAARESWGLITHHSAECPDVIEPDLEKEISEVLDELVARSPIDFEDRFKHERWLPLLLNQVSQKIAAKVADDPKLLARMTPRGFEDFVSKLFVTFGYDVELTKQTRDGGFDVVALRKYRDGPHTLLIETKRYAKGRPVGVAVVRQLLHVRDENRATRVVLATTSSFTKGVRELHRKHEYELELRDYDDLMSWAREAADLLRKPAPVIVKPRAKLIRRR
jgi:HJR/Mrr/RecB family endonuclease